MKYVHCKDTGTVQADGHEVLCTLEAWAWLDKIELSQFKPVRSPCKRWWAEPARYAGMDYHMEIWLRDPETCGGDMVEWVGTLELSGEGWLLCDARTLLVALQLDGAPAPVDLPIEPAPTLAEAMARGLAAVEKVMEGGLRDPGHRLSIDGLLWGSISGRDWEAGDLARVVREYTRWDWRLGHCKRAQSEPDGLLALWRATAALRAHAREVGL